MARTRARFGLQASSIAVVAVTAFLHGAVAVAPGRAQEPAAGEARALVDHALEQPIERRVATPEVPRRVSFSTVIAWFTIALAVAVLLLGWLGPRSDADVHAFAVDPRRVSVGPGGAASTLVARRASASEGAGRGPKGRAHAAAGAGEPGEGHPNGRPQARLEVLTLARHVTEALGCAADRSEAADARRCEPWEAD